MQEGWILLHRKLQDCQIWDNDEPFDMRSAWVDLLLLANHRDVEIIFDYKSTTIKRGQYLTSVRKLSQRWGWGKDKTLKYLRLLESLKMIKKDSDKRRTLITIEKYDEYQCALDTGQTQIRTESRQSADTPPPQTKNEKNEKNDKKNIYGEYKHVRLTQKQYDKLITDYGEESLLAAIKYLDEYMQMKGRTYSDHNLVLRKWVFDAVERDNQQKKGGKVIGKPEGRTTTNADADAEREREEFARQLANGEIPDERPFADY